MGDSDEFPHKYLAAAAVFFDERGRTLLVKPHYRPTWNLAGGIVEDNESPLAACIREVAEELSLSVEIGRLLVADYRVNPDAGESIQFVFDGGVLDDARIAAISLQEEELTEFRFVDPDEAPPLLSPHLTRRVAAALEARALGTTFYLEDGATLG